jgi:hypothetical protein
MKIPCKNCITLAICRHRNRICCDILYKEAVRVGRMSQLKSEDCRQKLIHRWWVRLKRQLHNANCIRNDKGEGEGEE